MFFRYLESENILHTDLVSPKIIVDFMTYLQKNYSSAGKSNVMFTLRNLLTCPSLSTHFPESLGKVITVIRTNKHERLPSFYSQEEVKQILNSVDRSSRQGKKDYLIILLAAQLGIRTSDIRCLKLDHIKWESNTIEFPQQKTKKYIKLPINEPLKFAILDYLKNSRANATISDADHLFIRTRAPSRTIFGKQSFYGKDLVVFSKIRSSNKGKHHGLHSLRHSLASQLLKQLTPITSIANALGQNSIEATKRYIQIDIEQLRTVALEVPGHELIRNLISSLMMGAFKQLFLDFIRYQRSLGYKYGNSSLYTLRSINRELNQMNLNQEHSSLSKTTIESLVEKRPNETCGTQQYRIGLLRQFSLYMNSLGFDAYLISQTISAQKSQ